MWEKKSFLRSFWQEKYLLLWEFLEESIVVLIYSKREVMEIKSIKEIENIWTFSKFLGWGCLWFEKLTFLYWWNTFWKTTLTDIFQSFKYDDFSLLINRKTIPEQSWTQKIVFKVKIDWTEKILKFDNNIWSIDEKWINQETRDKIKKNLQENLEVFWSEFIHKNLFTWNSIERPNKENFTEFILWEEWVILAQQIKEDKKILWVKNKNLKNIVPQFVKWKIEKEIQQFIIYNVDLSKKDEISNKLLGYKLQKQEEEKRLIDPQKILWIENLKNIEIPNYFIFDNIANLNNSLQKDYSDLKEEFLEKLSKHINWNFIHTENAENWIKDWYKNIQDKNWSCIFCWQSLENAKDIIDLYDKYFDENYSKFISKIEEQLELELRNIEEVNFNLLSIIQKEYTISLKYKEIIVDESFQQNLLKFEEQINEIQELELNESKKLILETAKIKISEKNKKPYKKIEDVNLIDFKLKFENYIKNISELKVIIDNIIVKIAELKEKYKDLSVIRKTIEELDLKIKKWEFLKARIEQDWECIKYISEQKEIIDLSKKVEEDTKNLKVNQNQYLEKYFEKINILFDKFWSHNFTLIKDEDNKWYKPVYSLKVKFHRKDISATQMQTVFSESDRRALALAIFWTKIELKEEVKRKNTIVILDDPITSFDNERTKVFIDYLSDRYIVTSSATLEVMRYRI